MRATEGFRALVNERDRELARALRDGGRVEPGDVAGSTWRGWNRSALFGVVRQRKFFKRFHPADGTGAVSGENVLARQDGLDAPWRARLGGRGLLPFAVLEPGAGPDPEAPSNALVIAYGAWGRRRLNPVGWVVDHVTRPDPGRPDLLLGESLVLTPGGGRWFLEHFVLERDDPGPEGQGPASGPRNGG